MVDKKFVRQAAINRLIYEWPSLPRLKEESLTFKNLVFQVCSDFSVARRTALEYIYTARSAIIQREKEKKQFEPIKEIIEIKEHNLVQEAKIDQMFGDLKNDTTNP